LVEGTVKVIYTVGLHARPASLLVQVANKFNSSITLFIDEKIADAKSIMSILALKVARNQELHICVEGDDEKEAFEEIMVLMKKNIKE
jgi:phosphocarrier protein HPr